MKLTRDCLPLEIAIESEEVVDTLVGILLPLGCDIILLHQHIRQPMQIFDFGVFHTIFKNLVNVATVVQGFFICALAFELLIISIMELQKTLIYNVTFAI